MRWLALLFLAAQLHADTVIPADAVIELNGRRYVPLDLVGDCVTVQPSPAKPQAVIVTEPPREPIYGTLTWTAGLFKGNPPDYGGKVWLVKEEEITALAKEAGGTAEEPIPTRATGWTTKLDAMFPKTIADGNGKFAFTNVAPGNYLIIYSSKRANGLSARDRGGKMRFKTITIEAGKPVDASFDFGVTAY